MGHRLRRASGLVGAVILCALAFQNCAPRSDVVIADLASLSLNESSQPSTLDAAQILIRDIEEVNSGRLRTPIEAGFQCISTVSEGIKYLRCVRSEGLPTVLDQEFTLAPTLKFAGEDLKFREISYGTLDADQRVYSDAACSVERDLKLGSSVSVQTLAVKVPRCKDRVGYYQCVDRLDCQVLGSDDTETIYVKNQRFGWTTALLVYELAIPVTVDEDIVDEDGVPTPTPTPTPPPSATPTPTPTPSNPDVASCAVSRGGGCWFLAQVGQSCDDVCANRGGVHQELLVSHTGSSGTNSNCDQVMDALGAPHGTVLAGNCSQGWGCIVPTQFGGKVTRLRCTDQRTVSNAEAAFPTACPCNR